LELIPRWTDGNAYWSINDGTESAAAASDTTGFRAVTRTASNARALYRNSALFASTSTASTAIPNANIAIGAANVAGGFAYTDNLYFSFIGGGMTTQNMLDLYNAVHAYLQAVAGVA
jgi:hypothetical protein